MRSLALFLFHSTVTFLKPGPASGQGLYFAVFKKPWTRLFNHARTLKFILIDRNLLVTFKPVALRHFLRPHFRFIMSD